MSLPGPKPFLSDGLFDSLFGATALSHDVDRAMPPVFTGDETPIPKAVKFVGSGGPVEIPLERDGFRDQVREALKLFSRVQFAREAVISRMPTQRWHESDILDRGRFASIVGPAPYKRYMALSFVDDAFNDVIFTGSQAVAEKLPAWEANARVVLAGAKRWAQQRWGGL